MGTMTKLKELSLIYNSINGSEGHKIHVEKALSRIKITECELKITGTFNFGEHAGFLTLWPGKESVINFLETYIKELDAIMAAKRAEAEQILEGKQHDCND
jgi:hypothetical protein